MYADVKNHNAPIATIIAQLEQLVAALDRRIPQVARAGERTIAKDAASLRNAAVARLAQLAASTERHATHCGQDSSRRDLRERLSAVDLHDGSRKSFDVADTRRVRSVTKDTVDVRPGSDSPHAESLLSFEPAYTD